MSGLARYLPNTTNLLKQKATIPYVDLSGKLVFFYFSASWCPPCRAFTPQLTEFYKRHSESKKFDVVLVSWDEAKDDFTDYYNKMPWLALPYEDRSGMEHLTKGFNVQSIPTLIGVDADTGKIITTTARNMVVKDPEAKDFPWPDAATKL